MDVAAAGPPYAVTVGADGARVAYLRAAGPGGPGPELWVHAVAAATARRVPGGPVAGYAADAAATVAAYARDGRLHLADLTTGTVREVPTAAPVTGPRPDPTGRRVGYLTGGPGGAALHVVDPAGRDELLAGDPDGAVAWGAPDPDAGGFGRTRGWWWSPDGTQVLAVRSGPGTSLHLLDLDGGWVDVHLDRETYPYLVAVHWGPGGGPLVTVLRRSQQHGLVLAVDPRTGETQVHAELADARWVQPVAGTPRHLPDGRVLVGGELAHDGLDARCLFADGGLLTPPGLYVRRVVGTLPGTDPAAAPDLVVEGTDGDPADQHVFRVRTALGGGGAHARRVAGEPGWWTAATGGDVLALGDLTGDPAWSVWRGGTRVGELAGSAPRRPVTAPVFARVTDRRLPAAVLYPAGHVDGRRLPVLLDLGDGPGRQQVVRRGAAWPARRWWADTAGCAVVVVDPRGTPGVAPSFEKAAYRRPAEVAPADLVAALTALTGKHPDLDLDRLAVRGTGLGGWLAVLTATRRPDLVRCAVARDPVVDLAALPRVSAGRLLGGDAVDGAARHRLAAVLAAAPAVPPLLLVGAAPGLVAPGAVHRADAGPADERAFVLRHLAGARG